MRASNIHYEMAEKARAVNCGGIGAIHVMINKLELRQEIDSRLHLLKKPPLATESSFMVLGISRMRVCVESVFETTKRSSDFRSV